MNCFEKKNLFTKVRKKTFPKVHLCWWDWTEKKLIIKPQKKITFPKVHIKNFHKISQKKLSLQFTFVNESEQKNFLTKTKKKKTFSKTCFPLWWQWKVKTSSQRPKRKTSPPAHLCWWKWNFLTKNPPEKKTSPSAHLCWWEWRAGAQAAAAPHPAWRWWSAPLPPPLRSPPPANYCFLYQDIFFF